MNPSTFAKADLQGVLRFELPGPGSYLLGWYLRSAGPRKRSRIRFRHAPIEVSAGGTSLDVTLPLEELRAAIARLH